MVGGPVFGPQPRIKQTLFIAAVIVTVVAIVSALTGCSTHSYIYRPAPDYLIPVYPSKLPSIPSAELSCLSDQTYTELVERERMLKDYADQSRALLGNGLKE